MNIKWKLFDLISRIVKLFSEISLRHYYYYHEFDLLGIRFLDITFKKSHIRYTNRKYIEKEIW
jgi:hypothetical protein